MPRTPAAKKNQHNSRHENGLVGPGRRITKPKSNGHLNGSTKPVQSDEPAPTPDSTESISNVHDNTCTACTGADAPQQLRQRFSESSADGHEQKRETMNGNAILGQRRSDMVQSRSKSAQDVNALSVAYTVIRSCPAGDTVALLIVLLALPSIVLTIVQALFASLTLMPPTNVAPISFLSLFDVFQGSAGSPSFGTMAVVDVICLGLWICLWGWAQNFALDLAQIQIAITLGNGNSGKSGSVNTFCFVIVLLLHSVRSSGVRRFFVSNIIPTSLITNSRFQELIQYLPASSDFGDSPGSPSKIRSLFAIHILSQAFMAFVRRRVANSQNGSSTKPSRRNENESYASAANTPEPTNSELANVPSVPGVDYQTPPTPSLRDPKDKSITAKKRRRQANQVRSRQPFWAALASTKVHVLREVEHKGHTGMSIEHQPSSTSQTHETVWITHVEPSTIQFETIYAVVTDHDQESALSSDSKPFFVRINGARWHSVGMDPIDDASTSAGGRTRWSGTISGLAPDCTYTCSFNGVDEEEEYASVMVKTPALSDGDVTSALVSAPARGSLRPSSPATTLRNSIQNAEGRLNEARSRLTRSKRTHRAALARIEKEADSLNGRLKSSSDDTRQRQKLLQAERSMRQTEEQTTAIVSALEELEAIPEDDVADYDKKKSVYKEQSKLVATANGVLDAAKAAAKNELTGVNTELGAVTSRKDRLVTRQARLVEQHDRITHANAQGLDEKERKVNEAAAVEMERQQRENEMSKGIAALIHDLYEVQNQIQVNAREIDTLERQSFAQRDMMLGNNGPLTPEGNLPGTNIPQSRPFMFSGFQASTLPTTSEQQSSPFLAYANTLQGGQRSRSNTNRSNGANSNFSAEYEDADPIPPMPTTTAFDPVGTNGRKSSGSSRSRNNGSPAGVIGDAFRSPHKGSHSPGVHTNTW